MQEINLKLYFKVICPFIITTISLLIVLGSLKFIDFLLAKFLMNLALEILVTLLVFALFPLLFAFLWYFVSFATPFILNTNLVKNYNKIYKSGWRKDLLQIGFFEIVEEIDTMTLCSPFTLKGVYENCSIQIKSTYNFDMIEIAIPLNLKYNNNFLEYEHRFNKQYYSQNVRLSSEELSKTIPIGETANDKIIWATINQLIALAEIQTYKSRKLTHYIAYS
jgi:hypothetical protein